MSRAGLLRPERRRMAGSLAVALLLHALLLALLLPKLPTQVDPGALGASAGAGSLDGLASDAVMVSLVRRPQDRTPAASAPKIEPLLQPVAETDQAPPVPTKMPEPSEPATLERADAAPAAAPAAQSASAGSGGAKGCDIAGAIQARLQSDPQARSALMGWPEARGLFAPMRALWDGRWLDTEALGGGDTVEPLRRLVFAVVGAAPQECLAVSIDGPLAFSVDASAAGRGGRRASIGFVLGTARWSWRDLLDAGAKLAEQKVAPG